MRIFLLCCAAAALAGCGGNAVAPDEFGTRLVTLANGKEIRVEVMSRMEDMARGMMFRDSLPRGRGMLFIHPSPGPQRYYMYQVKIPLDIVFIGADRRIAGIAANVPPCTTRASECPTYGDDAPVQFVLELAAGEAARQGLARGQPVAF